MAATIRSVAERAGVSPQTVSRFLNQSGPVSDAAALRIAQAIEELNYHPSAIARNLRRRRTGLIGIAVSNILNTAVAGIVRAAQDIAEGAGYAVITSNTDESARREEEVLSYFARSKVEGVVCAPVSVASARTIRRYLAGIPVVCARIMEGFDSVAGDGRSGVAAAVRLLIGQGHRVIGLISVPTESPTGGLRVAGYRDALLEAGLPYDERYVITSATGSWMEHQARSPMPREGAPPTAIVIANALLAPTVLRSMRRNGVRVPEDMSIITVEENVWAPIVAPPLTTISTDVQSMGRRGMELLIRRIHGDFSESPRHILVPMRLRVRSSAAPHGSPPPPYDHTIDLPRGNP